MATTKAKHSAPRQYLGYGLQTVRLCFYLLTEPADSYVLVEHDDDVSIHYADGSMLLEQTKSALGQNPISDWAPDFWKAISNWLKTTKPVKKGSQKISYRLYVTPMHGGSYAAALSRAGSEAEVLAFVEKVRADAKDSGREKAIAYKFAKRFLDGSAEEQIHLGKNLIVLSETDPIQGIRSRFESSVGPQILDDACAYAIGLAKEETDALIRHKQPARIHAVLSRTEFAHI